MSGEAMDGEKDEEIIEPSTADFYACPEMVQGYIKTLESKNAELEKEVERLGSLRAMREVVKEAEELRTRVESEKKRGDEYLAMYQDADRGVVELRTRVAEQATELKEWKDDQASCINERCGDEVHCTCVPSLRREVKELQNRLSEEENSLKKYIGKNWKEVLAQDVELEQRLELAQTINDKNADEVDGLRNRLSKAEADVNTLNELLRFHRKRKVADFRALKEAK